MVILKRRTCCKACQKTLLKREGFWLVYVFDDMSGVRYARAVANVPFTILSIFMKHEGGYYEHYETIATESLPEVEEGSEEYARLRNQAQRDQFKLPAWAQTEIQFFEKSYEKFGQSAVKLEQYRVELQKIEEQLEQNPTDEHLNDQKIEAEMRLESCQHECAHLKEVGLANYRQVIHRIDELFEKYRESLRRSPQGERTLFLEEELRDLFAQSLENQSGFGSNEQNVGHLDVDVLLQNIKSGKISPRLVYEDLKKNKERMMEYERTAERLVEEVKTECIQAVEKGVREGWLPQSARENLQRLATVKVEVFDRLSEPLSKVLGQHDANGTVIVYSDMLKHKMSNELRSTIMHELVHEIAGSTMRFSMITESSAYDSDDLITQKKLKIESFKSGIQVRREGEAKFFTGLNESITEWLSMRLGNYHNGLPDSATSYHGSGSYIGERKELDRLLEKGLELDVLLNAYFENIKKSSLQGLREGVYFKKLFQRIENIKD